MKVVKNNRFLRAGLFRRIYFHTVLVIVLAMVCVGVLFSWLGPQRSVMDAVQQLSRIIADQIEFGHRTPAELEGILSELNQTTDMSFALIGRDNIMYAQSGKSRLKALETTEVESLFAHQKATHFYPGMMAFPLESKTGQPDAYLLVEFSKNRHHWGLLVSLIVVFLVGAAIAVPLSRTISRPLEQLISTTSQFALGNLASRTGIDSNDEIGTLAKTMDAMALNLADRIRAEKELLANVSHELRTPLSRIKVALALCGEDDAITVKALQQQLTGIEGDVADLERLIQDVMDVARYDLSDNNGNKSGFVLRKKSVFLSAIAFAAEERFERTDTSHTLTVTIEENLPAILGDEGLLQRVVDNLLSNAAKYSPNDSAIELTVDQTSNGQRIRVHDSGIGISAEDLSQVFEPFFRTDRSRNRGTGGTGLGLALCKRIVTAHGGTITVASNDDGTTFTVVLPAQS